MRVARLRTLYRISMGQTILNEDLTDEGVPVYSATSEDVYFGHFDKPNLLLAPGDLVVGARGSIGFPKLVREVCTSTQTTIALRRCDTTVDSRFVRYWMLANSEEVFWYDKTAVPQLTTSRLGDFRVQLPDNAEQKRIANFLDEQTARIDALIAEKERLREVLSNWQSAELTRHCFGTDRPQVETGNPWIPSLPAGWMAMRLKHLVVGIEQGWSPECEARMADAEEWGVLKAGAANGGVYREDEHKALPSALQPITSLEVKTGDVLITRASGTAEYVGSFAFVYQTRAKLMLSDKNFRLRFEEPPKLLPELLAWAANTYCIRQQILQFVSGADGLAKNIGSGNLREVWFPVPPVDEQLEIVRRLKESRERISSLDEHVAEHLVRLREYRSSLISAAVTGQLDLSTFKEAA